MARSLGDVVSKFLSDEYLFDSTHTNWKDMVASMPDGWVPASDFMSFMEVSKLTDSEDDVLHAASQVPWLEVSPAGIRRRTPLDPTKDPALRTIFVKPLHEDTTEEEIRKFFSLYGNIESVQRNQYTGIGGGNRPSAFVLFSTIAEADKCVKAKPSYGRLNNIGDFYVPKLLVVMKNQHEVQVSQQAEALFQRNVREKRVAANQQFRGGPQQQSTSSSSSAGPIKFIPEGSILKINSKTNWRDMKCTVGELCKGVCNVVYVYPHNDPEVNITYIFMKTPQGAKHALDKFHALTDSARDRVVAVLPTLELCHKHEEHMVRENYLKSSNEQAAKKQSQNEKRQLRQTTQAPQNRVQKRDREEDK
eukprot:PhF_6_TR20513/c0_g1_i1/m.29575